MDFRDKPYSSNLDLNVFLVDACDPCLSTLQEGTLCLKMLAKNIACDKSKRTYLSAQTKIELKQTQNRKGMFLKKNHQNSTNVGAKPENPNW